MLVSTGLEQLSDKTLSRLGGVRVQLVQPEVKITLAAPTYTDSITVMLLFYIPQEEHV